MATAQRGGREEGSSTLDEAVDEGENENENERRKRGVVCRGGLIADVRSNFLCVCVCHSRGRGKYIKQPKRILMD